MSSLILGCNIQTTPLGKEQLKVSFCVMSGRCMGSSGVQSTRGFSCSARGAWATVSAHQSFKALLPRPDSAGLEEARDAPCLPTLSCQPALSFCRASESPRLGGVPGCRDQDGRAGARRQPSSLPLFPKRAQWHLHRSEGRMLAPRLRAAQKTCVWHRGLSIYTYNLHVSWWHG